MCHGVLASDRGFSLIEILLATGILATAAVTLASLFVTSSAMMLASRHRTVATILARARLEELAADVEASGEAGSGSDTVDDTGRPTSQRVGTYLRSWSSAPVPVADVQLLLLTVRVSTRARQPARIQLQTLVRRRP